MIRIRTAILLTLTALSTAGCVGSGEIPEEHFYRLPELQPASPRSRPLTRASIDVPRLRASGLLHERALLFSRAAQPGDLRLYHYHQWQDPPDVLVRDHLVEYLRRSGLAARVLPSSAGVQTELRLTGRLLRFERVIEAGRSTAAVEVEFTLQRGQRIIFGPHRYRTAREADGSAMTAVVDAFGIALQQTYDELIRDLGSVL